jgi:3-oxoacyl-[acyl-carrier-protein] synthase-1
VKIKSWISITPDKVVINGKNLDYNEQGHELLTAIYRHQINDYPKFFKMDNLCKLGFVASELLLNDELDRFVPCEDRAIAFFNSNSSLCNDESYQKTIQDKNNYFPSPAIFVYTLPNIVTGEIAIRNKYYGETSFYVLDKLDTELIEQIIDDTFQDLTTKSVLGGWLDCKDKDHFEAYLFLTYKERDK